MRSQIVININTEVVREKYESHEELAIRLDKALTTKINEWQQKPAYKDWYLLSVVQTGAEFPTGFFTTTWEFDDEVVKLDAVSSYPDMNDVSVAEDSDTTPHVQYGEVIRVNNVRFQLVSFDQGVAGATIAFLEEKQAQRLLQSKTEPWHWWDRV